MTAAFNLRYASHLGYLPPNPEKHPLFLASVGSTDVRAHVEFAAEQGLAGVLHPWAIDRPAEETQRFARAMEEFALQCGVLVYAPKEVAHRPLWVQSGDDARRRIASHLERSAELATALGASTLVVLLRKDSQLDSDAQWQAVLDQLRWAGDLVGKRGIRIGIEPMVVFPDMLLTTVEECVRLLDRLAHPSVKLVFDTAHMTMMNGDVLSAWRQLRHHVGPIQLADMPGRTEPGSGAIDFVAFLSEIVKDGRRGELLELEFGWSDASVAGEKAGMRALRCIDRKISGNLG